MYGDVRNRDFPFKEELKFLYNEGFWWLHRPGGDAFVCGLQCLAPLQGMKAGIAAKDNPVKDSNKWTCGGQGRDVICHPKHHFVGDHAVL